jgi:regulator of protease activity HflC (stomatin/prohibitin superfamily)
MIWFVFGVIFLIAAIVAIVRCIRAKPPEDASRRDIEFTRTSKKISGIVGGVFLVLALINGATSVVYTQDIGEVKVVRNFGGSLGGISADAGIHFKAPWQDMITYDVRNNILSFMGDSEADQFEGGSANGSAVTINDASGTSATIDIQVNYSLDPQTAEELYANYGSQENFVKSVCAVDIRAIPREVSGQFDTISILTARGDFTNAVQEALTKKWQDYGLIVEQVSIQNVVYPDSIKAKYSEATAAEIAKQTSLNEQEIAKVDADTKIIQANGEAEANRVLAESLTDAVIQQHYIDALTSIGENGNLVVVPENSTPMVGTSK